MEKKCKIIYLNNFIYILSDDEIKKGDWFINLFDKTINQANSWIYVSTCKKIIATTDTSLNYENPFYGMDADNSFPQPSQQFINKYIEEYNKGNVIEDVLLEYEIETEVLFKKYEATPIKLLINRDNTINIQLPKDSWNREELIHLLKKASKFGIYEDEYMDEWIEEHL